MFLIRSLKDGLEDNQLVLKEMIEFTGKQYQTWMNKSETLNLKEPLDQNDLKAWQGVPLRVYIGFLEDLVDKTLIFNEEYKERKKKQYQEMMDLELSMLQVKKVEEARVVKGRTRINAHPKDV